ncbi:MAG TPA: ThiF family adenylyltransferase [Methylotenera sp.]
MNTTEALKLPRIVLLSSHAETLQNYLDTHPLKHERAAIVFFKRLQREVTGLSNSDRYLSVDVIPFEDEWILNSSEMHIDFETKYLRDFFKRAEDENLVFGFAHTHLMGELKFSEKDNLNEEHLTKAIVSRNGKSSCFVALLLAQGSWTARVRSGENPGSYSDIRHLTVVGKSFKAYGAALLSNNENEIFSRQLSAFGEPFTRIMQSLRFVVVGAGGTGSATANLLLRSGAGEIIIIDFDDLEKSNLNRVHGSKLQDVGRNKAEIQASHLRDIDMPCNIIAINAQIDSDLTAVEALASADIVFGCTDDFIGREILNSALYFYLQPLIDMGLGGRVGEDKQGRIRLLNQMGRISLILPEEGKCLFCQRELNQKWIETQRYKRKNPDVTPDELKQRYLTGGAEEAPGVAPFIGVLANFAVSTLFELLVPHRKLPGNLRTDNIWIDFTNMEIKSNLPEDDENCPYCKEKIFLCGSEKNGYLGRPALTKVVN